MPALAITHHQRSPRRRRGTGSVQLLVILLILGTMVVTAGLVLSGSTSLTSRSITEHAWGLFAKVSDVVVGKGELRVDGKREQALPVPVLLSSNRTANISRREEEGAPTETQVATVMPTASVVQKPEVGKGVEKVPTTSRDSKRGQGRGYPKRMNSFTTPQMPGCTSDFLAGWSIPSLSQFNALQHSISSSPNGSECSAFFAWQRKVRKEKLFTCFRCPNTWAEYQSRVLIHLGYRETSAVSTPNIQIFGAYYRPRDCESRVPISTVANSGGVRLCAGAEIAHNWWRKGDLFDIIRSYCTKRECKVSPDSYLPPTSFYKSYDSIAAAEKEEREKKASVQNWREEKDGVGERQHVLKLPGGSLSHGLALFNSKVEALKFAVNARVGEAVVQEYEMKPLLINNKKIALRTFILITSLSPLRVYWIEGPVFQTLLDYTNDVSKRQAHFTNSFCDANGPLRSANDIAIAAVKDYEWMKSELDKKNKGRMSREWVEKELYPNMEDIMRTVLLSALDQGSLFAQTQSRSVFIACFDFLVNEEGHLWFHEINAMCGMRNSPKANSMWKDAVFLSRVMAAEELAYRHEVERLDVRAEDTCLHSHFVSDIGLKVLIDSAGSKPIEEEEQADQTWQEASALLRPSTDAVQTSSGQQENENAASSSISSSSSGSAETSAMKTEKGREAPIKEVPINATLPDQSASASP